MSLCRAGFTIILSDLTPMELNPPVCSGAGRKSGLVDTLRKFDLLRSRF
ncbi:hypothetical protein [Coleofasciculus sp. E2-BRE-01]